MPRDLFVVTPVYEDTEAARILFRELGRVLGDRLFIVAVDDGSVSSPLSHTELAAAGVDGVVISLKRNVGHQRAIAVGLNYVSENCPEAALTVVMDSDGEDLPATVLDLVRELESQTVDVVVARRKSRVESLGFKVFYQFYKLVFQWMTGRKISFGNFMVLSPSALKRLTAMQELWVHLAACVMASKLRVAVCPLARGPRYAGKSKMNFVGLALHGFRAFMVFAEDVMVRIGILCFGVAGVTVVGVVAAIVLKVVGLASPGWFSLVLGILAVVFLQVAALGVITLLSLLFTGVVRGMAMSKVDYRDFVRAVALASD